MRFVILLAVIAGILVPLLNHSEKQVLTAQQEHACLLEQLHKGNYDSIPAIIRLANEILQREPENAQVNADLGFLYLWNFSERGRHPGKETLKNGIYLSNYFFKTAMRNDPSDPRLKGFQAATEICAGALSKNIDHIYTGYVNSFRSIKDWPQFNKFAFSLVSSQLGKNSPVFRLALKYQWDLLDDCTCQGLSRSEVAADPEAIFRGLIAELQKMPEGKIKRACWNSETVPHNYEGFLLNFGDMLVKAGEVERAKVIYGAARLSPSYREWPYKNVLEDRIRHAEFNSSLFDKRPDLDIDNNEDQLFINSAFSCTGCHQMGQRELQENEKGKLFQ